MKYPLVLIKWSDHTASAAWESRKEAAAAPLAFFWTVGYLIHETTQKVVVCQCVEDGGDGLVGNRSTIAKKNIVERHELDVT